MRTILTLDARLSDLVDLGSDRIIENIDFTIESNPSLKAVSFYSIKGKKERTEYRNRETDEVVVEKIFTEDYENKNLQISFVWYDRDGNQFAQKIKLIDIPNEAQWESRFRSQRERIMDDLKGRAKKYNASQYIIELYSFFNIEKQDFVETGSLKFADAVRATLAKDTSTITDTEEKARTEMVKTLLNTSLDGEVKVYETLVFLTTI